MPPLFLVMLGGAFGSGARFLVGRWALAAFGPGYPYGTLAVNLAGGLAMGLLSGVLVRTGGSEAWRLLIGVGVLGGFTTFSSFGLELHTMLMRGDVAIALGYALVSTLGALLALAAGVALTRIPA